MAGTEIRTNKGRHVGSFRSLEEAQQYIQDNGLEQVFQEPELPELVVKRKRGLLEQGASNFEETFGMTPKEAAEFLPIVGEGIAGYDIQQALRNEEYKKAGLLTAGLLLPFGLEKVAKPLYKGAKLLRNRQLGKTMLASANEVPVTAKTLKNKVISSGNVKHSIDDSPNFLNIKNNQDFEKEFNSFAEKYGYDKLPKGVSREEADELAKQMIARHNTYARGVTKPIDSNDIQSVRKTLGENASDEDILKYVATHRRNEDDVLWVTPYDNASIYGEGKAALVRRRYNLGDDRLKWFKEGDFDISPNSYNGERLSNDIFVDPWYTINSKSAPTNSSEIIYTGDMDFVDFVPSGSIESKTSLNRKAIESPYYRAFKNTYGRRTLEN